MGDLTKWAQKSSPFLKVPIDGECKVTYLGHKIVPDPRDASKEKVQYKVEFMKQEKLFESSAGSVAMAFDTLKVGDLVIIKKTREGQQNRYTVSIPGSEKDQELVPDDAV